MYAINIKNTTLKQQVSPFSLHNETGYQLWKYNKLNHYPIRIDDLIVHLHDPRNLTIKEKTALNLLIKKTNMAIYDSTFGPDPDKGIIIRLGHQLGINRLDHHLCADADNITTLKVVHENPRQTYIPYTDKSIQWHNDGYSNPDQHKIRSLILHCVSPADEGGINALFDHEIVYMMIREKSPAYIKALMSANAVTIPAHYQAGNLIRPAYTGPVFSIDRHHNLHMNYTDQGINIHWNSDPTLHAALHYLKDILNADADHPYLFKIKLHSGQGIICNNVLHNRSAFNNTQKQTRLLYRARYYNRIGTL